MQKNNSHTTQHQQIALENRSHKIVLRGMAAATSGLHQVLKKVHTFHLRINRYLLQPGQMATANGPEC